MHCPEVGNWTEFDWRIYIAAGAKVCGERGEYNTLFCLRRVLRGSVASAAIQIRHQNSALLPTITSKASAKITIPIIQVL